MTLAQSITIIIFIVVFLFIATEVIHRTYAALLGTLGMVLIGAVKPKELLGFIDIEILAVVFGMFLLVKGAERSGLFRLLAVKIMKSTQSPTSYAIILLSFTMILALFVSNIGAMLIAAAITVTMSRSLKMKPQMLMIFQAILINIGGMMLWMSSVPNIIIALEGEISFFSFLLNILPLGAILYVVTMVIFLKIFKKELATKPEDELRDLEFDEWMDRSIEISGLKASRIDLSQIMAISVLLGTVLGFIVYEKLALTPAFVALAGGCLMLMIQYREPNSVLKEIDWSTIFFLAGLFIMVNGLDRVEVIEMMSKRLLNLIGRDPLKASIAIMWLSGLASSLVDNIPLASSLAPVVKDIVVDEGWKTLWWGLVIGANLGGNITPMGSPSTVIAFGVSKQEGYPISFKRFFKIGLGITIFHFLISMIYLYIKYCIF